MAAMGACLAFTLLLALGALGRSQEAGFSHS